MRPLFPDVFINYYKTGHNRAGWSQSSAVSRYFSPFDLLSCSSEPPRSRASFPGLLERSQAWASSGPLGPQKAPPNPAACTQLIFLVATLLTAPPTD